MRPSILLFALLLPLSASAQVVISEIAWMGTPVEGADRGQWWRYEWLELYNAGGEPIALEGWELVLSRQEIDARLPLEGAVEPGEYYVLAASERAPRADFSYDHLGGVFSNEGQLVSLVNGRGRVVEQTDHREGWKAGENRDKRSMERRSFKEDAWGSSRRTGGTPGTENTLLGVAAGGSPAVSKKGYQEPSPGILASGALRAAALTALLSALALLGLRALLARGRSPLRGELRR